MNTSRWQLHKAKKKFSEVVRKANDEGPQIITKYGQDSAVILSEDHYKALLTLQITLEEFYEEMFLIYADQTTAQTPLTPREVSAESC